MSNSSQPRKQISQPYTRIRINFGVVKESEDPKSDSGKKISPLEKKEIMKAIKDVEDKILKIKLTIDSKK